MTRSAEAPTSQPASQSRAEMTTILFVCTGNVCRSPMAEVLMDRLVKDRSSLSIRCLSAGLGAMDGHPASAPAEIGRAHV